MGNGAKKNNHFTIWGIKGDTAKTFNSPNLSLSNIIIYTKFSQRDRPFLIPVSKYYGNRSVFGISLIKIFGFRQREIRRLYLNGNMILIALGAVVCIPLSKALMDAVYPVVVANVACGLNLRFDANLPYVGGRG